ncbi:DUF4012 domain-containing protein [Nocardioides jensenii]|uniref:DUF4012 domain-containing protein n=1 Tax=Nocardioides jensenii TaxID=1843 RepID=UPI0008344817|nr:DUF4012 domain-containing protein [Nocardioides jensenii]
MRRRYWVIPALVVVLAFVAYAGWRVWQVRSDLTAAQNDATRLRSALTAGDQSAAESALADLKEHSTSAAERTDGPLWSTFGVLPLFGDDADGVKVVSDVLADLSEKGLPPLVDSAADLEAGSFTPRDGRLSIAALESTQAPIDNASGSFTDADARLSRVDSENFVGSFKASFDDLADQIHRASRSMDAASTATDVLPTMLGKDGKRRYLLVFQNNAELRSSGGLPSAGAIVTTDDGKIEMVRQVTAGDFPYLEGKPPTPITAEETALFGRQVGDYFQDANFTPHFPRTAELMAAHWKREFKQDLDGVMSIDPVALSYLMKGTGPMTIDGVQLTSENAVDELLNKIYVRVQDPVAQNEFFAHVAKAVFDKFAAGAASPQKLLEGLARSAEEHRLLVTSFDETEEEVISDTVVAGRFLDESDGPRVGVYLNDGTGSKMSYYLDYDVSVHTTGCAKGAQRYSGKVKMLSDTPEGIADLSEYVTGPGDAIVPKGDMFLAMHIYAPEGGRFNGVFLDGQELPVTYLEHEGHEVASLSLLFHPNDRREVTFRMVGAEGAEGDTRVDVTPGTAAENESSSVTSSC